MPSIVPDKHSMHDKPIHVAVGVVVNPEGKILIAKRPEHLHQGGLWEFPGGKVESGEQVISALRREFEEELGLVIESAEPLLQVAYQYTDKSVLLDVFSIKQYSGEANGLEGQSIRWVSQKELADYPFPAANQPILHALQLPKRYLITGAFENKEDFIKRLQHSLQQGIKLVQLRAKQLTDDELFPLAEAAKKLCGRYQAELLINSREDLADKLDVGLHLNSRQLITCKKRPISKARWLAASVHNEAELQHAKAIGVDFVVISPVLATPSHPDTAALGWEASLILCSNHPFLLMLWVVSRNKRLSRQD